MFGSAFFQSRFKAVGSVGDLMRGNCIESLLIQLHADGGVATLDGNYWLECF